MARGEWQPPTVTYRPGPGGEEFISGVVPALTPKTYDPDYATEKLEKVQAETSELASGLEIEWLNGLSELDLGEEILNGDSNEE